MLWLFWTQNVPTSAKLHLRWVEEKYTPAGSTSALLGKTDSVSQDIYDLWRSGNLGIALEQKYSLIWGMCF